MLTEEQQRVVDTIISTTSDNKIIGVDARAGSGKTSTAEAVINAVKPNSGFYTAFNKAIVEEGKKRFGKQIEVKTTHALAYKHIRPKMGVEELTYNSIKETIPYEDKKTIIDTLDDFFRSAEIDIEDYVTNHCREEYLREIIVSYAQKMLDDKMPVTFNFMLKCLHILLQDQEIQIDYDLVLLDECQDTTAVTLEIFKLVNAKKKIMLGDTYQNIYSYMNTVNGFEELTDIIPLYLTKSFRCNNDIADQVQRFGLSYLQDDFKFTSGNDHSIPDSPTISYISRTNASLIQRMYELKQNGQRFRLIRSINEIFALPIALLNANSGRSVFDKRYNYLEKEYSKFNKIKHEKKYKSFFDYIIDTTGDTGIETAVNVLRNFSARNVNIYALKESVEKMRPNPNIILSTAHAFKGLETDIVYLENDLNSGVNRVIADIMHIKSTMGGHADGVSEKFYMTKEMKETLNVYYVALSRAKHKLHNVEYMR